MRKRRKKFCYVSRSHCVKAFFFCYQTEESVVLEPGVKLYPAAMMMKGRDEKQCVTEVLCASPENNSVSYVDDQKNSF